MPADTGTLVRVSRDTAKTAADTLGRAFMDYPMLRYFYPGEAARAKITRAFVSLAVYSGTTYGEVYAASPEMEGVAVWFSSVNYPVSGWRMLRSVPLSVLLAFATGGAIRMKAVGDYIEAAHKRLAPFEHRYLEVLGVAPAFQGKGYAGRLLRPALAAADESGLPCYLETLDEKNVPLYEHFGFAVVEKSAVPDTELTCWAMLRGKGN